MWEKYPGMSVYAYCFNNPVVMVDPDGRIPFWFSFSRRQSGFGHHSPQWFAGYGRFYDNHMGKAFDIQGTEFKTSGVTVRLWKGDYGKHRDVLPDFVSGSVGGAGGEIGLYNPNSSVTMGGETFEKSMSKSDLSKIGLESTSIQVFNKKTGKEVGSRTEESSSFWTTVFSWDNKGKGEELYSTNTFNFKDEKSAKNFYNGLMNAKKGAEDYPHNEKESIDIKQSEKK
jgi:hypothetical protein